MWEVEIYTGDMYAYRFVFELISDMHDFISEALLNTTDDLEVKVRRVKKGAKE